MADEMTTDRAEYVEQTFSRQNKAIYSGLYDLMLLLVMETASFRDERCAGGRYRVTPILRAKRLTAASSITAEVGRIFHAGAQSFS